MKCLVLAIALAATGCDTIANDPDLLSTFACTVVPYYAADCGDPAVQAQVKSVLVDGAVAAQANCIGVALGAAGKFVSVAYQATKLQDGSCLSSVNLTGPAPAGGGFAQSSGTTFTRRPALDCPATSWHVPQLRSTTTVAGGVVRVESPFCGATPCTMPVATNCSGLHLEAF